MNNNLKKNPLNNIVRVAYDFRYTTDSPISVILFNVVSTLLNNYRTTGMVAYEIALKATPTNCS